MSSPAQALGARRRIVRMVHAWLGTDSVREAPRDVRLRARAVMGSAILATIALAATVAIILTSGANGLILRASEQRA